MGIRKAKSLPTLPSLQERLNFTSADNNSEHFTCNLVTPMYGGGVSTGEVDKAMPIRATAIRGQLRHWWRLLNRKDANGKLRSAKELFETERAIWGGLGDEKTLAKSKVIVSIKTRSVKQSELQSAATYQHVNGELKGPAFGDLPGYALFPGKGEKNKNTITKDAVKLLKAGYSFQLSVAFGRNLLPPQREQVLDALRWWATFGGVGARTRRGCGAVQAFDQSGSALWVSTDEVQKRNWILILCNPVQSSNHAWNLAANLLKDFRQKPGLARKARPREARPGRSYWPEPDATRRITGKHALNHAPIHPAGNVFPRAVFGLPIIFQFKGSPGDPDGATLKPIPLGADSAADRMASPLILRPYQSAQGWHGAVLCLDTDHVKTMRLSLEGDLPKLPYTLDPDKWAHKAASQHVAPMDGRENAIDAFLAHFARTAMRPEEPIQPPPNQPVARTNHAQGVAGVQLTRNGRNESLQAKHEESQKTWIATGDRARKLFASLPVQRQEELKNGRYIRADIQVAGHDILAVREPA